MDDKDSQENPNKDFNKLDLNQLQSFSFGTQWTQEKAAPADPQSRGQRPRADDRGAPRRDRREFRKPAGGSGAPSGDRGAAPDRREQSGDRRPRRDFQGGGQGGAPSGGQGGGRFADRREQPQFQGPYNSPYFTTSFYPEDDSFAALAKTIRASCRTIELFEIAKTVVAKNDRFIVVLTRRSAERGKEKSPLYISVPDGLPFESEEEVVHHVMANHLGRFFDSEEAEVDAPKGNFQVINKCGVTGELLGPPNYHRYNQFVQQHYAAKIKNMPFEAYRNRIESVRDPEAVTQWTDQMKKITRFTWKAAASKTVAKPEASAKKPAEEVSAIASELDAPIPAPTTESADTPAVDPSVETPVTSVETPANPEASSETEAPATDVTSANEEVAAEETPAVTALTFDTIEDARLHLLTEARTRVVKTVETVRFSGRLLESLPDSEIRRAAVGALEHQRHFPLDTANGLRGRLRREHFTIFKKGSKGISYVCAVKRKFRVPGQIFADSIGSLISFIESHQMVKGSELITKFLKIEEPKPVAPTEQSGDTPVETPASVATVELTVEQKTKIARMQGDLRWLVMEGYVTEFIDGRLFASPPIPESKKHQAENSDDDTENFPENPVDEAPAKVAPKPASASKSAPTAPAQSTVEKVADSEAKPVEATSDPKVESAPEIPPVAAAPEDTAAPEKKPEPSAPVVSESTAEDEEEKSSPKD